MKEFIADLHIHSPYSRATSPKLNPEGLDYWSRLKGIKVIGTGDFTHPKWLEELKTKLEPAEEGLYKLKAEYKKPLFGNFDEDVRFMLTAEISNIYKKNGKVRKNHNLIFAPSFAVAEKIQQVLQSYNFNITSDGRPILGLDARDLLEISLEASPETFFVPAHIWTPWFSLLGSKSGFDSVEECFGDLTEHIYALETGLSSDPPMNYMCSFLDKYTFISNSDAHSPEKLGREANLFNTQLNYRAIIQAIKNGNPQEFLGTLEFYPEEGKYHYDGHRKCEVCFDPVETLKHQGICPQCQKPVVIGVSNRIAELADRDDIAERPNQMPFESLVPLKEIFSEIHNVGVNSKKVNSEYFDLLQNLGSELAILRNIALSEIKKQGSEILEEAIRRVRNEEIYAQPGFDGEFGKIKVFAPDEDKSLFTAQNSLFGGVSLETQTKEKREVLPFDLAKYRELKKISDCEELKNKHEVESELKQANTPRPPQGGFLKGLNPDQRKAVEHSENSALVLAGPGTGKTRVLTYRIVNLIQKHKVAPENILAITFTNQAAQEMRERLEKLLNREIVAQMTVTTFHALGHQILQAEFGKQEKFSIIDENEQKLILSQFLNVGKKDLKKVLAEISQIKQNPFSSSVISTGLRTNNISKYAEGTEKSLESEFLKKNKQHVGSELKQANTPQPPQGGLDFSEIFEKYNQFLAEHNLWDFDDLLYKTVHLFLKDKHEVCGKFEQTNTPQPTQGGFSSIYQQKFQWILVDEYQDINATQYAFLQQLMPKENANLFAIGDPNQAIYAFRGADVAFIRKFQEDYPQSQIYKLQTSYRCPGNVLQASQAVLEEKGELESLQKGVKIKISEHQTDQQEAEFVARKIEAMLGGLRSFSMYSQVSDGNAEEGIESLSDFAILCRTRVQMSIFETALQNHSIPYQLIGEKSFFQKESIRNVLDVLKSSQNPENVFLKNKLEQQGIVLDNFNFLNSQDSFNSVTTVLDSFFPKLKTENPQDFQKLFELVEKFDNLDEFLAFVALGKPVDTYDRQVENVSLLTMHASKGLEFKTVFLVGLEDGLMPYALFENQQSDPEEEKRLLYVAMTRAQDYLFLNYAKKRFLLGRQYNLPKCPFLNKIEQDLLELQQHEFKKKVEKEDLQQSLF